MSGDLKLALLRVVPFLLVIMVVIIRTRQGDINPDDLFLNKPVSNSRFLACVAGFTSYVLLVEFVLYQMGMLEINPWNHPMASSFIRILGAVILAPITEELIFRGLLLMVLTKKLSRHISILIQALIFVLLHNFAYENTMTANIGIVQSFIDACLFGYAKYYTRSIYTSMAMHSIGNLVATLERFIL
ncbi:CPBP family intramembrane glutamic endopeptidase [Dyadobacter luticola]|uniref:CPBP family intramembrane metalloprotease n=1 Tax=Dyadobacter luticola TaxID=1979387 RepID=A0A5R9L109_9BACT|nr:CPBP family intramembrane glutamic endopeptidase [Dyadobacter luticola]TLV02224.1 CPBP family intramembrane metalloprotease [Dyadobacter luticola]